MGVAGSNPVRSTKKETPSWVSLLFYRVKDLNISERDSCEISLFPAKPGTLLNVPNLLRFTNKMLKSIDSDHFFYIFIINYWGVYS